MQRAPFTALQFFPAIDRVAEHVDDAPKKPLTHGNPERMAHIDDRHTASKPRCRGQGNPSDRFRIEVVDHFNDDAPVISGAQLAVKRRNGVGKPGIHDAATHRKHSAASIIATIFQRNLPRTIQPFLRQKQM